MNIKSLGNLALIGIVFFLVTVFLAVFFVFPKMNQLFESQYSAETEVELALETRLFTSYIENKEVALLNLAKLPGVVDAAMLSDASNPNFIELLHNVVLGKEASPVVLQNIDGTVLVQTKPTVRGQYGEDSAWVDRLILGEIPYYFRLLEQRGQSFTFQLAVPVAHKSSNEGVLSAEVTVPFNEIFIGLDFNEHMAVKLVQDHMTVATDSSHIKLTLEKIVRLDGPDIDIVYITDRAIVKGKEELLRNTILLALLAGLAISFLIFVIYGYRRWLFGDKVKNKESSSRRVYFIPIVAFSFGVAANVIGFLLIENYQEQSYFKSQLSESKGRLRDVQESIDRKLDVLISMSALFNASDHVSRREFSAFAKPYLNKNPEIQALEWIPNVAHSQRLVVERSARKEGAEDYGITELNSELQMVPATERSRYYPVYYVEPLEENKQALGYDLGSDMVRMAALTKASDTGNSIATAPIRLVQETDSQPGLLIFQPIYPYILGNDGVSIASGFILLVVHAEGMIHELDGENNERGSIIIHDITDPENPASLFGSETSGDELIYSEVLNVAGRTWRVDIFFDARQGAMRWLPILVLIGGVVIVALISIGLVYLIRRHELVENLVKQRTSELRMLSSIAANSNDMFIVTGANGLGAWEEVPKITYVNEAFSRFTGYSFEEAVGNTPEFLLGKNTNKKQLLKIQRTLERGEIYEGELLKYKKNNEKYWVDIHVSPLRNEAGEIVQYSAVQRDVTERKKALVEREKMIDELTDSNEELERFAFVCSHDLQEPLRMIRSFSEKLQTHIGDDLENDEKGKKYFKFITNGAARAQNLIADILSYSSISNDTKRLQLVSGQEIINEIKITMQISLNESRAKITTSVLPMLQGNKTQLHQLFQNLINNALKYQAPGSSPHVNISVADAGGFWQFSVADNGIGMEQRHLDKIFDVFQRLHRTSQYSGTGVGLSICKKVVSRHGGKIWVESEVGVGSTFHFTLLKPTLKPTLKEVDDDVQRKAG